MRTFSTSLKLRVAFLALLASTTHCAPMPPIGEGKALASLLGRTDSLAGDLRASTSSSSPLGAPSQEGTLALSGHESPVFPGPSSLPLLFRAQMLRKGYINASAKQKKEWLALAHGMVEGRVPSRPGEVPPLPGYTKSKPLPVCGPLTKDEVRRQQHRNKQIRWLARKSLAQTGILLPKLKTGRPMKEISTDSRTWTLTQKRTVYKRNYREKKRQAKLASAGSHPDAGHQSGTAVESSSASKVGEDGLSNCGKKRKRSNGRDPIPAAASTGTPPAHPHPDQSSAPPAGAAPPQKRPVFDWDLNEPAAEEHH